MATVTRYEHAEEFYDEFVRVESEHHVVLVFSGEGDERLANRIARIIDDGMTEKLVRDRIPGHRVVQGGELLAALRVKLDEEAEEVNQALDTGNLVKIEEEIGDVIEVCYALARFFDLNVARLHGVRRGKLRRKGGFLNGVMMRLPTASSSTISKTGSKTSEGGVHDEHNDGT